MKFISYFWPLSYFHKRIRLSSLIVHSCFYFLASTFYSWVLFFVVFKGKLYATLIPYSDDNNGITIWFWWKQNRAAFLLTVFWQLNKFSNSNKQNFIYFLLIDMAGTLDLLLKILNWLDRTEQVRILLKPPNLNLWPSGYVLSQWILSPI